MRVNRTNTGRIGRWLWRIDRASLVAMLVLMLIGVVLAVVGSPAVAERIGESRYHFVFKQTFFLSVALVVMVVISFMDDVLIRRSALLGFAASVFLLVMLFPFGTEIKGATRWLYMGAFSIQPSEFLKPFMAVSMAWVLAEGVRDDRFPSFRIAMGIYAVVAFLLVMQPDMGMTVTITSVFLAQLFMAGLTYTMVLMSVGGVVFGGLAAYASLPHVRDRIDRFIDPSSGDNYQVEKSLQAIQNGGIFGQGPGEGQVKLSLPDSHTDFIFSVAGEEFGLWGGCLIIFLFMFIVLRGYWRVSKTQDMFVVIAVVGLLAQFGVQAAINLGVAVNLLPAKGMTLPFVSYGGSSLVAIGIGMGMVLALTKLRYGYSNKLEQRIEAHLEEK